MHVCKLIIAILLLLAFAGFGVAAPVQPKLTIGQVLLPEQEVRTAVERFLTEKLAGRGWETSIRQLTVPPGIRVSDGQRDLELIAPAGWDGWGAVTLVMIVRVNGAVEKNLSLRLQVEARTEMLTSTRQLLAGSLLKSEDLQMQKQDLALAGGHPVKNLEDAVGKKVRLTVRAGAPIRNDQLVKVPVVVSGQLVTIIAENSGLKITVSGRAKSSGSIGDLIRVQNLASGKELPARVLDASTVEVGF